MNILDMAILAILIINLVIGIYNGFLVTILNIIAYFASWILGFLLYPTVSKSIIANTQILDSIIYYTNFSSRLASFEEKSLSVMNLNAEQMAGIVENAQIPHPFNKVILSNLANNSLKGLSTLGEYFDYSVANIIINILSFLIIFFIVRLIFAIIIGIAKVIKGVPVLKQLDSLMGAGLGFVRGILILYVIFYLTLILTINSRFSV